MGKMSSYSANDSIEKKKKVWLFLFKKTSILDFLNYLELQNIPKSDSDLITRYLLNYFRDKQK